MSKASVFNRRKILSVHNDTLICVLNEVMAKGTCVPNGSSIVGVWFDHTRNAFDIVLVNQAFDVVPNGEIPPRIEAVFDLNKRKEATP